MLKRFIFILVAGLCLSGFVLAQDTTKLVVPKKVKNRVLAMWPQTQAVPVTWTKEGAYFKASLLIMEKPAFAIIDTTGKLIQVERRLHVTYLPKKIIDQLNKQYPGIEILDIYELTDAAGKVTYRTTYQFKQTTVFAADGTVVK